MKSTDAGQKAHGPESELYYHQIPSGSRPVKHTVDFSTAAEILEDEPTCRELWDLISTQFKTRSKFLAIWQSVRYVATHHSDGVLVGFLLVSAPVNWQIDYVVVRPEFRGQGIAESLVNATVNQALLRKTPYVMLTSREGLRPLYEAACGFTVVAQRSAPGTNANGKSQSNADKRKLKISC